MATNDDDDDLFQMQDAAADPAYPSALKDYRKTVIDQRAACGSCGSVGLCKKMRMARTYDGHATWTYVCDRRCSRELHQRHPRDRSDRVVFEPEFDSNNQN